MTKTPKSYLFDIISYGEQIEEYLQDVTSLDEFESNNMRRLAIERCIEIVCEASLKLKKFFQIELTLHDKAYNFRGSLVHQYEEIRKSKVYLFAINYIPNMVSEAKELLMEEDE